MANVRRFEEAERFADVPGADNVWRLAVDYQLDKRQRPPGEDPMGVISTADDLGGGKCVNLFPDHGRRYGQGNLGFLARGALLNGPACNKGDVPTGNTDIAEFAVRHAAKLAACAAISAPVLK